MIKEVSSAMSDARQYAKITEILWWRMGDCHGFGTKWRHGYKACLVMVSLLRLPTTSESLVPDALNHLPLIKHLMHFDSMAGSENNGKVRSFSRLLYILINDINRYRRWRSLPLSGTQTVMRVASSLFPTVAPRSASMQQNSFRNMHNDVKPPKGVKMAPASQALRRRASDQDPQTRAAAIAKAGASPAVEGRKKRSPSRPSGTSDMLGLTSPSFGAASAAGGGARTPFDDDWGSDASSAASSAASTPSTTPAPAPAGWQTFGDDDAGGGTESSTTAPSAATNGASAATAAVAGAGGEAAATAAGGAAAAGGATAMGPEKVLSVEEIKQGLIRFYKHTNPGRVEQVQRLLIE
jgi:hypothetical protein